MIELQSPALGVQPGGSLLDLNKAFAAANHAAAEPNARPEAQLAAAEMLALLAPERKAEAVKAVGVLEPAALTLQQTTAALSLLSTKLGDADAAAKFKAKAHAAFKHAPQFAP